MPIPTGTGVIRSLRYELLRPREVNGFLTAFGSSLGTDFTIPSSLIRPTGQSLLTELIRGGLGVLESWLTGRQRLLAGDVVSPPPIEAAAGGTLQAAVAVIRAAGGIVVGNVVRIARAAWRKVPDWAKLAISAAGLSVIFDEEEEEAEEKPRKRKRRGITASELRGFHKITSLLCRIGMTPRIRRQRRCPR